MVSWIALGVSILSLGFGVWIYFHGPRFTPFEAEDLYDALLEQNDAEADQPYKPEDEW